MKYNEEEIIKLIKIHDAAMKKISNRVKLLLIEVNSHREFLRTLLINIKQPRKKELSVPTELPNNVLFFSKEEEE